MISKIEHIDNISYVSYYNTFGKIKELHVFENDLFLYKCVYKYNKQKYLIGKQIIQNSKKVNEWIYEINKNKIITYKFYAHGELQTTNKPESKI